MDEIAGFVDVLWEKEGIDGERREGVEDIWKRVLDVEKVFWPSVS